MMTLSSSLTSFLAPLGAAVANHLWQSTVFCAVVWVVTLLLRRNSARVRYGLWLAASIKFLVPFSLLIGLGGLLPKPQRVVVSAPAVYSAVDEVALPFSELDFQVAAPHVVSLRERTIALLPIALAAVWFCGVGVALLVWFARWRQVSLTLRRAVLATSGREFEILRRMDGGAQVALRVSQELMEPGVFGIFRPVLIWPERLSERLEEEHIAAIVSHELMHVRRRDNLTAALHMMVEAAFWFHPMVWWMERRMVEERERACDEAVVEMGGNAEAYAESLLKACRFCVESPLVCVSGISGADLSRRVRSIMRLRLEKLSAGRKVVLAGLGFVAIAGPVAFGVVRMTPMYAQILHASGPLPSFEVATVKLWQPKPVPPPPTDEPIIHQQVMMVDPGNGGGQTTDRVNLIETTKILIARAYDLPVGSESRIVGGPDWLQKTIFYAIQAKIEDSLYAAMQKMTPAQQREQVHLMVQSLLADRFKLKVHFETREMPVYELVLAKGGSKLTPAKDGESTMLSSLNSGDESGLTARAANIDQLVHSILWTHDPALSGRQVVDQTGLKGAYDFTLKYRSPQQESGDEPVLFTAMQEQLGLKLVPSKGPVEVIVIDHIEQPAPQNDAGMTEPPSFRQPTPIATVPPSRPGFLPAAFIQTSSPEPVVVPYAVSSVRESKGGPPQAHFGVGVYYAQNMTLRTLIHLAYGLQEKQIVGGPAWLDVKVFDIDAKSDEADNAVPKAMSNDQQISYNRRQEQLVLADRFHLKMHSEQRETPVYALVVAKSGLKMHMSDEHSDFEKLGVHGMLHSDAAGIRGIGRGQIAGIKSDMDQLTRFLAAFDADDFERPITNMTGLTGTYDFKLQWTPGAAMAGDQPDASGPGIFTAIEEQLGLKLEPRKGSMEVLVVDHVETPSEN